MRLLSPLAVALLSVGGVSCSDRCDASALVLYWHFEDASGAVYDDCVAAGVSTLRVFLGGVAQVDSSGSADLSCATFSSGIALPLVRVGTYALQIEAYDTAGLLLYLTQTELDATCGEALFDVSLAPQQGPIDVSYVLPSGQCPTSAYVWFSLTNVTTGETYAVVNGQQDPASVVCSSGFSLEKVPFGTYQLDDVEVVQATGDSTVPYDIVASNCDALTLDHQAADTVSVTLATATSFCP